jgi:hypothetical protein
MDRRRVREKGKGWWSGSKRNTGTRISLATTQLVEGLDPGLARAEIERLEGDLEIYQSNVKKALLQASSWRKHLSARDQPSRQEPSLAKEKPQPSSGARTPFQFPSKV